MPDVADDPWAMSYAPEKAQELALPTRSTDDPWALSYSPQAGLAPSEFVERSLQVAKGQQLDLGEIRQRFEDRGLDYKQFEQQFKFNQASLKRGMEGGDPRNFFQWAAQEGPFVGLIGKSIYEDRVHESGKRFKEGRATDEDIERLADAKMIEDNRAHAGKTVSGTLLQTLAATPTILTEMAGGGAALRGLGIFRGAAPTTAAFANASRIGLPASAMRAALAEPTLGRAVLSHAGRMAAMTPLVPSMYVDSWHQRNKELGLNPNDLSTLPAAMLHSYGTMLVLGSMQNNLGLKGNAFTRTAAKGPIFALELGTADAIYNQMSEQILPKWLSMGTHYGSFEKLMEGDLSGAGKKLLVDTITGAWFAGIHEAQTAFRGKPFNLEQHIENVAGGLKEDLNILHRSGLSKNAAVERMGSLNQRITEALVKADQMFPDVQPQRRLVTPEARPEATADPRLRASVEANQALGAARTQLERGQVLTRPGEVQGRPMTASEVVGRLKVPGTNKPSVMALRIADSLRKAEEALLKQEVPEPGVPVSEKPTEAPVAPESPPEAAKPKVAPAAPEAPIAQPEAAQRARTTDIRLGNGVMLEKGQSGLNPSEAFALNKYGNGARVPILDKAGNEVGSATVHESGDTLHVSWMGESGKGGGDGRGEKQPFGSGEIINVAKQLALAFPDFTALSYTPASGRIGQGKTRTIDLAKLRERAARTAEPVVEKPPDPAPEAKTPEPTPPKPPAAPPLKTPEPPADKTPINPEEKAQVDRQRLEEAMDRAKLNAQERRVVLARADGRTMEDIGKDLGVKRQRVEQIERAAFQKLGIKGSATKLGIDRSDPARRGEVAPGELSAAAEASAKKGPPPTSAQGKHDALLKEAEALTEKAIAAEGKREQKALMSLAQSKLEEAGRMRAADEGIALGGFPLKLPLLEEIAGDFSFTKWMQRWFASAGELPASAFKEKGRLKADIEVHVERMRAAARDLTKALGGHPSKQPQAAMEQANRYLEGDKAAGAGLRPEVRDALDAMRNHIDLLSASLINSGAAQGRMAVAIASNLGSYLTRQYRVFTDPRWASKVDPAVKNRFISWLDAEIRKTRVPKPGEVEGLTQKLLVDGTAADNPIAFLKTATLGSKDLGIFQARKNVPPELRALWGEYKDPLVNYVNSVGRMAHLLANHEFQLRVRDIGLREGFFSQDATVDMPHPVAHKDYESMSALGGLHTTKEIARAFQEAYAPDKTGRVMRAYMKLLGMTKYSKTVLSGMTHITNALSNVGFLIRNGHFSVTGIRDSLRALTKDTPAARKYWEELVRNGVVGDSVMGNEFKETLSDALNVKDIEAELLTGWTSDRAIVRWIKKGGSLATKLYHNEDAYAKIVGYESEKARYRDANPTWTAEEVERKAAENIRRTYPSYSQVPAAVRALRRFPLLGPFVSFSSEVVRTTYHTAKLAVEELRSGNPKLQTVGAKRLSTLFLGLGFSVGLAAAARAITGTSRDDESDMRRFMPEWTRSNELLHLGRDDEGNPLFQDLGRIDPHSYLIQPIEAALQGRDIPDAAWQGLKRVAAPFVQEEILTKALLDLRDNEDSRRGGKPIYNPEDSPLKIAADTSAYLGKAFLPGTLERLGKAMGSNDPDAFAKAALAEVSGYKKQPVKPAEQLVWKYRDFDKAKRDAEKIAFDVLRDKGPVPDEAIRTSYLRSEERRRVLFDELSEDVRAAQRLGVPREKVVKTLKDAGASVEIMGMVMNGQYRPNVVTREDLKGLPPEEIARRIQLTRPSP